MDYVNEGMSAASSVFSWIVIILLIIANWKIFQKAGEAGWKSLIPFYNAYISFKITFRSGWFFLLMLIPVVNIIIHIMYCNKLSKAFGHGIGFTLGLIFLPNIFTLILGFNGDTYHFPE